MTREPQILIIGAGPTGLGAAWRLHELGHRNWLVADSAPVPGGLAASVIDDQGFTWDMGGHVLFSHYEYFDRLMDDLLGDAWVEHVRESWVWIRDRFVPYPFQNNIWRLPAADLVPCLRGLLAARDRRSGNPPPGNFHEWIIQNFGEGLAEVFMLPYNRKVWAYDPSELSTIWMGERVATVDFGRILENLVLQRDDCAWGPNARFRFPLHGGTGSIWRALHKRLPAEHVKLGRSVTRVSCQRRTAWFSDGTSVRYDCLINSMPLDLFVRLLEDRPDLAVKSSEFKHSSSHIVGIGVEGRLPETLTTKCWMYFPELTVPFYRVTVFSNYSPNNVPVPGRHWSLMGEVSESPQKPVDGERIIEDVIEGFRVSKLLPSDAVIASRWHRRLEHGYPTPFLGRDALLEPIDNELRKAGIWSRGRFGGWKYEVSNQDHSLMQGVEAIDHILSGAEETTYRLPNVVNARKGMGPRPVSHATR